MSCTFSSNTTTISYPLTEECEVGGGVADELDEGLPHGVGEGDPGADDVADGEDREEEPYPADFQAL